MSFCKIHNSPKYGDILIQRGFEPESDSFVVKMTIEHKKQFLVTASVDAKTEENMNTIFDTMHLEKAEAFLTEILP